MAQRLEDLVDIQALAELLSSLYQATGLASVVVDRTGSVAASAGWMQGCGINHLPPGCAALACRRGSAFFGLDPGPCGGHYALFKCFMGFCDAAAPIVAEGECLGSVHLGQFLCAPPDEEFQRGVARRRGVPEDFHLDMLRRTPVVEPERLGAVMDFLSRLVDTLAAQGRRRSRLAAADQALAASEARYRRLLASVTNYIYTVRLDKGRIASVTHGPGCEGVTGYASRDFESDPLLWRRLVHEKDRQAVLRFFEAVMTGHEPEPIEHRIRRKDGAVRWIRNTPVVMRGQDGGVALFEGLVQDVTEQKLMEEELRAARLKAEQASRAKSEFLANMSHEIRTPMNAILGLTRLAQRRERDPEVAGFLEGVAEAGASLLTIINDILDFSKIEAGRLEMQEEAFDPGEVIDQAARTLGVQAARKGLAMAVRISPDTPRLIEGDPARFRQVLVNLLGNAVKFTPQGSVELTAGPVPGGEMRVSVRDTGIGIPEDKLEAIFDTFTQADAATTRRFGGTGLGLAISRQLAEMMGGRILVESREGEGSTFHFELPLKPAAPARQGETLDARDAVRAEGEQAPPGRRLCILVAEDEPANQIFARTFLEEEGHDVVVAENGVQTLEKLASGKFDLVFMDVSMPVMDGLEATRAIRSGKIPGVDPALPVVALTAHAIKGDRERFLEAGMDTCVVKPVDLDELSDILGRVARGERPASRPRGAAREQAEIDREWVRKWYAGKEQVLATILSIFRDEAPRRVGAARAALEQGDAPGAARAAHSLKGSAAVVGAVGVRALAARVEEAALSGRTEQACQLLDELEHSCACAVCALEEEAAQGRAGAGKARPASPG